MARRKKGKGFRAPVTPLDFSNLQDEVQAALDRGARALSVASMAIQIGLDKAQKVANAAATIQDPRVHFDIACRALVRFAVKHRITKEFALHTLSRAFDFITPTGPEGSAGPKEGA